MAKVSVKSKVKERACNRSYGQPLPSSSDRLTITKQRKEIQLINVNNALGLRHEPSETIFKDESSTHSTKESDVATKESEKEEIEHALTKERTNSSFSHVVEFWRRCAMLEKFISSFRNCNVELFMENRDTIINPTHDNTRQCQHDDKLEEDRRTLSTLLLMSDERFQVAAQCLLDAKKLIMHFHDDVDGSDDDDEEDEKVSEKSNLLNDYCEMLKSKSVEHHVPEMSKTHANDKSENNFRVGNKVNKNDQLLHVDASKEKADALRTSEPLLLSEMENVNKSFSHWRYWLPLSHVQAFIALLELSESAVPSRTNSFFEFSVNCSDSSTKCWWLQEKCVWVTSLLRASQLMMQEYHNASDNITANYELLKNDGDDANDNNNDNNQIVRVAMCLCPINERMMDARLLEVNRIWHLRRTHSTLMPRIQSCATLTDVITLFFAYPDNVLHMLEIFWENQHNSALKSIPCADDVNKSVNEHKRFASEQTYERTAEQKLFWLPTMEMLRENTMYRLPLPAKAASSHHALSMSHSDYSNDTSHLNDTELSLRNFENRSLHLCEEQLLDRFLTICNQACLIDSNTWGVIGLRPALRCINGIYWVDCWNRSCVLNKVIELAEWYGLPPFLRSIRRHSMSSYSSRKVDTAGVTRISGNVNTANINFNNRESSERKRMGKHNTEKRLSYGAKHETHAIPSDFLLFLSPELLNKTYFTQPDPVQMQVVREEIIDLTIKHCAFGMIIGEADQIVHLLISHCNYQRALVETRLGQCTTQLCTNPLAEFMQNTLDKVHHKEKEKSTMVRSVNNSADSNLRNNLINAEVDWICDNRWSDELTYYGIIYAVVKRDNANTSDNTSDAVFQNNKVGVTDNMLYYIAAIIEYKR